MDKDVKKYLLAADADINAEVEIGEKVHSKSPKQYYDPIIFPTVDNIFSYMHNYEVLSKSYIKQFDIPRDINFEESIASIEHDIESIKNTEKKAELLEEFESTINTMRILDSIYIKAEPIDYIVHQLFVSITKSPIIYLYARSALLTKSLFHKFIVEHSCLHIINLYNKIFNDKLYDDIHNPNVFITVLPEEWIQSTIKQYKDECIAMELRRRQKKSVSFSENEIVGAKDSQGNWWLSRVLKVYEYTGVDIHTCVDIHSSDVPLSEIEKESRQEIESEAIDELQEVEVPVETSDKSQKSPKLSKHISEPTTKIDDSSVSYTSRKITTTVSKSPKTVYLVEFMGWGDKFIDAIIDPSRIEKFKPKKHRLFRGIKHSDKKQKKHPPPQPETFE